jgi:hypothetical protein
MDLTLTCHMSLVVESTFVLEEGAARSRVGEPAGEGFSSLMVEPPSPLVLATLYACDTSYYF